MDEQKPNHAGPLDADLDRTLDTALAKYAVVEPRAGLDGRILANLRAERSRVPERSWWTWGLVAAAAAVFVVAIALALRPGKRLKPAGEDHRSATVQPVHPPEQRRLSEDRGAGRNAPQPIRKQRRPAESSEPQVAARLPKLDQFPSSRPLSEQEKLALEYVENHPDEAMMIAQAQTALAKQEELERKSLQGQGQDIKGIEKFE